MVSVLWEACSVMHFTDTFYSTAQTFFFLHKYLSFLIKLDTSQMVERAAENSRCCFASALWIKFDSQLQRCDLTEVRSRAANGLMKMQCCLQPWHSIEEVSAKTLWTELITYIEAYIDIFMAWLQRSKLCLTVKRLGC